MLLMEPSMLDLNERQPGSLATSYRCDMGLIGETPQTTGRGVLGNELQNKQVNQ